MSHDIPNLGIIDASVFVTAGPVNPTSTICALAMRAAEHLIARRRQLPVPRRNQPRVFDLAPARVRIVESETDDAPFDNAQLARLTRIGDALMPAVDDLPGAGTLIVREELLDRVLAVRGDLREPLRRAVQCEDFGALAASDTQAWLAAITVIAGAYYVHDAVHARIGYRGQQAAPLQADGYPSYIAEGLLEHLQDGAWQARWSATPD